MEVWTQMSSRFWWSLFDQIRSRAGQMRVRGQRSEWGLGITICHSAPSGGHSSKNLCFLMASPLSPASWLSHTPAVSSWSRPGAPIGVEGKEKSSSNNNDGAR